MSTLAVDQLHWDAQTGIGYLPVSESPYDAAYFEKYAAYARTPLGAELNRIRLDLVRQHAGALASVIDVGVGSGSFVMARGGRTYGYDVNPVAVEWLKVRLLWRDPHHEAADALTFWDVLEHIADPRPILANARRWVFVSVPIWRGRGAPGPGWRHYRPTEHCWYWTRGGLLRWMEGHGFVCRDHGTWETDAGREDIETFAFRRKEAP